MLNLINKSIKKNRMKNAKYKSIEKGLFEDQNIKSEANYDYENDSKDSIEEYEKIISEKLEQKRKEELKKAAENMKHKLLRTGRCPI